MKNCPSGLMEQGMRDNGMGGVTQQEGEVCRYGDGNLEAKPVCNNWGLRRSRKEIHIGCCFVGRV